MKVRSGFVSNSSTTSFSVFGVPMKYTALAKKFKIEQPPKEKFANCVHKFDRDAMKFCPECGAESWDVDEDFSWGDYDFSDEPILKDLGLDVVDDLNGGDGGCYVGRNIDEIKPSKKSVDVLKDLQNVAKVLNEILGKDPKFYGGICEN